ncbi:translocation/assembly module TamB domain-containing protein [Shewanella sp. Isolate11]|uniref:autotransporter assembly complex protein TamB n=1 Tax=Shewanella sp. Isolate11 TaxID=2908530 RepID=UPI001EFC98B0|nr:translocation/assembly module TamB domain-containing protein [Shewanella sp. Isolate11]MCG9696822.1 translocation/assembly module TamB domain-containing protein [Shewanella sp. Isolate11]
MTSGTNKTSELRETVTASAQATPPRSIFRRCLTWLKNTLRVILYLPLLLLVLLAIFIGTPLGTRIAVNLADAFVPNLEVSYHSGTLNSELKLDYANWSMAGIKVEIDDLQLDWRPLCLVQKQLCVNGLETSKANVEIDIAAIEQALSESATAENPNQAQDTAPEQIEIENGELQLPIGISLTQAALRNINVRVDEMHFAANSIHTQASWLSTGLRVNQLSTQGVIVNIPINDNPSSAEDKKDDTGWLLAQMPQVAIPMPIFIDDALMFDSQIILGKRQDNIAKAVLQGSYVGHRINLDQLLIEHDYGQLRLDGHISLKDHYPMALNLDLLLEQVKELPQLEKQHIDAKLNGDLTDLKLDALGNGHINFQLASQTNLTVPTVPYSLHLNSDHIMWPLQSPSYEAKQITLDSQGSLLQQTASFTGEIQTPYQPPLQIDTQLSHAEQQVDIKQLDVSSSMGSIQLNGLLAYGDELHWDVSLNTQALQLQRLNLGDDITIPNTLIEGHLRSQGKLQDKHWLVGISEADIKGNIDDYPLELQGDVSANEQYHLNANHLLLKALQSEFSLSGSVADLWALEGHLSVPDLSLWHPDAAGAINVNVNVTGSNDNPMITLDGDTSALEFTDISLLQAKLKGFYRPLSQQQFALFIDADDIQRRNFSLDTVNLHLKGDQALQELSLQTQGSVNLDIIVDSRFDIETEKLDLAISKFNFDSMLGLLQLDKPIIVAWDNKQQQGSLTPFCWQHQHGNLCVKDTLELSDTGDTSVTFDGDIGALLAPLLPQEVTWYGPATLDSHFSWAEQKKPQANVEFNMTPGKITVQSTKRKVDTGYHSVQLSATLDEKLLQIKALFESDNLANINSHIEIGVTPDNPLSGEVNISDVNLNALAQLTPQLEIIEGMVSSHLSLSGSLQKPQIVGELTLIEGQLLATSNPTKLDDINMSVSLGGQYADIKGSWKMGDGKADLNGNMDWRGEKLKGKINLNGEKLAVIQPPMVILDVSPSLEILFSSNSIDIKGQVDVPSGHIKIVQLPEGGIAESNDVIFSDSLSDDSQVKHPIAITSKIKINVGNQLLIDGMGLRGKLQGTLDLRQEPFNPPHLYGDVKVVDGSYKFMGQTLTIKTGEVQFIGPIEVPNLNIVAVREIKAEDVTAGVRITGTPLKPIVTLFSTPTMEHAEILSYIIKGTGINSNSGDQNSSLMLGAALTLSNQLGNGEINSISSTATGVIEKLGISNVQLDTNDEGKVAISGYVGENLMVKYGVGVFTPGYEMTVRYYLMSQLYLETVSSAVEKSLDIYYNFNID